MRQTRAKHLFVMGALFVGTLLSASAGSAQPKDHDERKEKREERREERKEAREERKEERKDARDDRKEERKEERKEHKEDIKDEWKEKRKAWREKREDRRKEWREEAKKKWGDLVDKAPVREELRVHGRRMARLERVRFLAEASGKKDLLERADKAIEREKARHEARMAALKTEAPK